MKLTTKLTIAAVTALLPMASSAFASEPYGETDNYRIVRIQVGNGIAVTAFAAKEPTTVALNVHGMSAGRTQNADGELRVETRQGVHGNPAQIQYVQGGN